eukprot:CAMPEP_0170880632 /NCGR_PEP_ID=MMETSP0734-20130129/32550_1 /TAXON_ID=186038 /ORGANISM="Fragilariopsis kerguelensis, Strain L26-C5" /LENGTH=386 /DNA_ID=CAMNT_0011264191 /DNA_START=422 /DNA_END=1582 /DNA_ORIENTATION=+
MGICGPSTCFTWKDVREVKSKDACMCGCGYLNGMLVLCIAQLFTFVGAILSLATLGDCSFATTDLIAFDLSIEQDGSFLKESRGVGFVTFQLNDGHCYFYDEGNGSNFLQIYWNILGDDWVIGMVLTMFCAIFAWYFFLYSLSFCCSSQVKCCRYTNGFCLAFGLVVVQACTFLVYGSQFCQQHNCTFSRSAGYSIGAIVCYLIAGVAFFFSKDYPGDNHNQFEEVQDVTNKGMVYHEEDPDLNPFEMEEARRASQQLGMATSGVRSSGGGGGTNLLPPPPDADYDNHYNEQEKEESSTWTTHDFVTPPLVATNTTGDESNVYNDDDDNDNDNDNDTDNDNNNNSYETEMAEEYIPVTHPSNIAEPLERPIDVVESDQHPAVDAQY